MWIFYKGMYILKKWLEKFDYIPMGLMYFVRQFFKKENIPRTRVGMYG